MGYAVDVTPPSISPNYDTVVIGAGPAGCVLALLQQQAGRPVVLQRQREASPGTLRPAFRPLALSHASRLILERVRFNTLAWTSNSSRVTRSSSNVLKRTRCSECVAVSMARNPRSGAVQR